MMDYLGSQRLLGHALGQHQKPVPATAGALTNAKLTAMVDWDEADLQVNSLITLQLSLNLRTNLGMMSKATWTSLDQNFGIYKDYELTHSIRLTTDKNHEIQIQKIWTILECLQANTCVISNYLEGMLLLKAITKEWDSITQMYCNGMQMANITFQGVQQAINAEFERTACLHQLAHQADKISAVK